MNKVSIIELNCVSKSFADESDHSHPILDNINFKLNGGEFVSVRGESGIGKTTFMNIISLLEQPDSGKIFWGATEIFGKTLQNICKLRSETFGFIFQNHNLLGELNVLENVLLPLRIRRRVKNDDLKFAKYLLSRVHLSGKCLSTIGVLSGGEKQRIAIVRAMMNRPSVILADEPTGNLDEANAHSAVELMMELCMETSSALILVTHNQDLWNMMNVRYIISDGKLHLS